jgi:hypothetical protein
MELFDKPDLERKRKIARSEFEKYVHAEKEQKVPFSEEIADDLQEALSYLEKLNQADLKKLSKDLGGEATRVLKDQLLILSVFEEFAFLNKKFSDQKKNLTTLLGERAQVKTSLFDNKVIAKFRSNETYRKLKERQKVGWGNEEDTISHWYKGVHSIRTKPIGSISKKKAPLMMKIG